MKVSLIIPTYNEAPVIASTVLALHENFERTFTSAHLEWEIVVVDNASTDNTAARVRALNTANISVIELTEKGKGHAVRSGFLQSDSDIYAFTDADLSVSPEEIAEAILLVYRGGVRSVIGSRAHPDSLLPGREWWRNISSLLFNILTRTMIRVPYLDTQCPLKVMDRSARDLFLLTEERTWFFDAEYLALMHHTQCPVFEVPVTWNEHRYPSRKSKLSTTRDGLRSLAAFWRIRRRLPQQLAKIKETLHNEPIMQWIIVGLGNPGSAYAKTRHNVGRMVLEQFRLSHSFEDWEYKKAYDALVSRGEGVDGPILLLEPETFMNASGKSVVTLIKSPEQAARLIVIHDDIDLPIGEWKISYDRGSGGHNGIKSLMETIKTNAFIRVRVGIAPVGVDGKMVKPKGEEAVSSFVLGKFSPDERVVLENLFPKIVSGLETILHDGVGEAMQKWNGN